MIYKHILIVIAVVIALTGCGTTRVGLNYVEPASVMPAATGSITIETGLFLDQRGEPANWLGAVRGTFGNPLKEIETTKPVSVIVQQAFADGLRARKFATASISAGARLSGVIKRLDCNQFLRQEAHAEIEVTIIDLASRRQIFSRMYKASNDQISIVAAGIFGSPETLRAMVEKALQDLVDKSLDDPKLRAALQN